MNSLGATLAYWRDNWDTVRAALVVQVELSLFALCIAVAICVPLGILAARSKVVSLTAINLFGTARAIPSLAILYLMIPLLPLLGLSSGFGFVPALIALTVLACPPILVNTSAGFGGVDPAVVEAARGMGMSGRQILGRIEFPLALPVVLAGVRTSALEVTASATLATFIAGGGLGDIITNGLGNLNTPVILAGAIPVAVLALCVELLFGRLQRVLSPSL